MICNAMLQVVIIFIEPALRIGVALHVVHKGKQIWSNYAPQLDSATNTARLYALASTGGGGGCMHQTDRATV